MGCRGGGGGGEVADGRRGGSGDAGGDAQGHPRVHSPCCGSTSLCWVLICGLPAMWSQQRERKKREGKERHRRKTGMKGGQRERGSNDGIYGMDGGPHYAATLVRIPRQNEALSPGSLHPHNMIIELCLIYLKLCSVSLHFGVPEWLQEISDMICIPSTNRMLEAGQEPLCILYPPSLLFYA